MPGSSNGHAEIATADDDAWPWRCVGCGATIYHDGEFCPDCETTYDTVEATRSARAPTAFFEWMRREPFPAFALKVTLISGVELGLTVLWLRLLLYGLTGLPHIGPLLG